MPSYQVSLQGLCDTLQTGKQGDAAFIACSAASFAHIIYAKSWLFLSRLLSLLMKEFNAATEAIRAQIRPCPALLQPAKSLVLVPRHCITARDCLPSELISPRPSILSMSTSAIFSFFSHAKVSPNRLIYIAAGIMFEPASPKPFGRPKMHPGYVEYTGTTAASLLQYIVSASFNWYWSCRGGEAIDFLAHCVNKARALHFAGNADFLNELMLKGVKKGRSY
ncbi:hypothetical protein BJ741DRAFT_705473 [Chytriomyces cf. hyalinus JEL632]|nr:hypothetical protein BJ741DRAFT_705473 [Chytriomyces cf. hyalinus JEL632]